jgi:hypothetical protein
MAIGRRMLPQAQGAGVPIDRRGLDAARPVARGRACAIAFDPGRHRHGTLRARAFDAK